MTDRDESQLGTQESEDAAEDVLVIDPDEAASDESTEDLETISESEIEGDIESGDEPGIVAAETEDKIDQQIDLNEIVPAPIDSVPDEMWILATGALLLGALDPADATLAGHALSTNVAARSEIVSLLPVADILTSLYQAQSSGSPAQEATVQATQAGTGTSTTVRTAVATKAERPRSQPVSIPKGGGITPATIVAIGLGVLAALGILWALAQRDQISTRDQEIDALRTRVAEMELGGNASVFVLNPVSEDAAGARATVFYSPGDGTVLLSASGLPELDDDEVYQVWYQNSGDASWQPGPTFRANSSGEIVRRLGSETAGFSTMAITVEPAPGSTEPDGDILLQGELVRSESE